MKFEDRLMMAVFAEMVNEQKAKKNEEIEASAKIVGDGIVEMVVNASMVDAVVCLTGLVKEVARCVNAEPEELLEVIRIGMGKGDTRKR